jgi:hypothetical protein
MSHRVTVRDLIDALEDLDENTEVRIVHQQGWPLQEVIGGLYDPTTAGYTVDVDEDEPKAEPPDVVYLVANGHPSEGSPYGDKSAWEQMGRL